MYHLSPSYHLLPASTLFPCIYIALFSSFDLIPVFLTDVLCSHRKLPSPPPSAAFCCQDYLLGHSAVYRQGQIRRARLAFLIKTVLSCNLLPSDTHSVSVFSHHDPTLHWMHCRNWPMALFSWSGIGLDWWHAEHTHDWYSGSFIFNSFTT